MDKADIPSAGEPTQSLPSLQTLADQLLLQRYSPPAVLVTKEGDILYVSGKTGKYLEPAAGKANWNLFAMAREGLGEGLSEAFHKAVREQTTRTIENLKVGVKGDVQTINIVVQPLTTPETLKEMVMIVFVEAAKHSKTKARSGSKHQTLHSTRLTAMAQELQRAHEDLQAARGEMQISQEELRSTNEESQSMNEELQSTNEELTTSKEEMQSMNEELQTVNHELQAKIDELSYTSNDMKNLLNSTDIATLFLDNSLLVRRFTNRMAGIIKLISSDIGRPVTDLVTALDYPELAHDIQDVMQTKTFVEKSISARDGRWFTVRIMPYVTHDNQIDGVVVTFADTTKAKKLEAVLRMAQSKLEERFSHQTVELNNSRKRSKRKIKGSRPTTSERKRAKG